MRLLIWICLMPLLPLSTSCSLMKINSNIPLFGQGLTYEIVNLTDCYLTVAVDGRWVAVDVEGLGNLHPGLMPGQSGRISIRNYSDTSSEVVITVKAYLSSQSNKVVDAISFREGVSSTYKESVSRIIKKDRHNRLYVNYADWWQW